MQWILAFCAGALVGMVLGVIGGGGSILAVPLLLYLVGLRSPHVAIGTSAVAVAFSAAMNLLLHARRGTVKWRCAALFSVAGVLGAWAGATLGKATDGQRLIALFGVVMLLVAALSVLRRTDGRAADVHLDAASARHLGPRLVTTGFGTGLASGFFGIGGGFLIVPGLMFATDMPMLCAVSSSLLAVATFALTTAVAYAASGLVDWPVAAAFVAGGVLGGIPGTRLAGVLAGKRRALGFAFAAVVMLVGIYMVAKGLPALLQAQAG